MLVQRHDTGSSVERQALALVEDAWATEVVPRLPTDLAAQARASRPSSGCGVATPTTCCAASGLCPGAAVHPPAGSLGGADRAGRYFGDRVAQAAARQ